MLEFDYQALNTEGQETAGRLAAESAALAIAELEQQGLAVQALRQVEVAQNVESAEEVLTPTTSRSDCEQALVEHVGQLLAQREVLAPALAAFAAEMPPGRPRRKLRKLATQMNEGATAEQIVDGVSLSVLLPLLSNDSLRGSHRSLDNLLAEAAYRNRTFTVQLRIFAYPLLVLVVALTILIFLGLVVVPTFTDIFDDFDLDLPPITQWVINFSNALRYHSLQLLLVILGAIAIVYSGIYLCKYWGLPGRLLGVLASGNSTQVTALAIFSRTLAEALGAGFSLSCALRMAGKCSNLRWLRREADALAATAQSEWCLPEAAAREAHLPATVAYALRAGPSGAPSLPLLREVAELYAERVRNRLDWSTGFIPQFTILLVGIVVGGVVLALYLPLVTLINGLTG